MRIDRGAYRRGLHPGITRAGKEPARSRSELTPQPFATRTFLERILRQIMQELQSLLQLLAMLATDPRTGVLFVLLIIASVTDYRTYRIPNWLTLSGIAFGLIYNTGISV